MILSLPSNPPIKNIIQAMLATHSDRLALFERDRFGDPIRATILLASPEAIRAIGPKLKEISCKLGDPSQNQSIMVSPELGIRMPFISLKQLNQSWSLTKISVTQPQICQILFAVYAGAPVRNVHFAIKSAVCPIYYY